MPSSSKPTLLPEVSCWTLRPGIAAIALRATAGGHNLANDKFEVIIGWEHFRSSDSLGPSQGSTTHCTFTREEHLVLDGTVLAGCTRSEIHLNEHAL